MRSSPLFLLAFLAVGCSDSVTIEGNLLEASSAAEVRSGDATFLTEASEFRLEDISGDTVQLVFSGGADGEGVMTITGLPSGGRVRLEDVWIENGLAFPTRVDIPGEGVLAVNGLRMGAAARVEGNQEIPGTILAISRENGTLMLRPDDESLPDVGVFLGTGTVLQTMDGEPAEFGRLGFGDSLIVRGTGASGYVLSNAILWGGSGSGAPAPEPSVEIDPVPTDRSAPNADDRNGRDEDADEDRGRNDDDRPGNRGRGRPSSTPGRRT